MKTCIDKYRKINMLKQLSINFYDLISIQAECYTQCNCIKIQFINKFNILIVILHQSFSTHIEVNLEILNTRSVSILREIFLDSVKMKFTSATFEPSKFSVVIFVELNRRISKFRSILYLFYCKCRTTLPTLLDMSEGENSFFFPLSDLPVESIELFALRCLKRFQASQNRLVSFLAIFFSILRCFFSLISGCSDGWAKNHGPSICFQNNHPPLNGTRSQKSQK